MADARTCPKCAGLQLKQIVSEDCVITQFRCLNCGRIDEPGLVPNFRIFTWGMGQYTKAAQAAAKAQRERDRQ